MSMPKELQKKAKALADEWFHHKQEPYPKYKWLKELEKPCFLAGYAAFYEEMKPLIEVLERIEAIEYGELPRGQPSVGGKHPINALQIVTELAREALKKFKATDAS